MKGRKFGIARPVVLMFVGAFVYGNPLVAADVSALSTPELKKLVEAGEGRYLAAFGKHKSVTVQGEIRQPDAHLMLLSGMAVPNDGNFSGFGIHVETSCLMVKNPKGRVLADSYMDDNLFYLGEGQARNVFGAPISCSIYGGFDELPANIRAAVKKAYLDFQPAKVELDRRLEPERKAARAVENKRAERIHEIDARLAELQHQKHARPGSREEDDRVRAVYRESEALSDERRMLLNGMDPEKERAKETAKTKAEQVEQRAERQTELLDLKRDLEGVRASLAEANVRCKGARDRLHEATRSQSMGRGTTDEEINQLAREETSTCNERGRLSQRVVMLEDRIGRLGGAADESTTTGRRPTPATEVHSTSPTMNLLVQKREAARSELESCQHRAASVETQECVRKAENRILILTNQIRDLGGE